MIRLNPFFSGIIGGALCMTLYAADAYGQCPTLSRYNIELDQAQKIILTFDFEKGSELTHLKPDAYEYNLLDANRGVYLYTPSKLDAGFHEDKNITVSIEPSGTIKFRNVPPENSYRLVVSSPECKRVYGPEEGITVKKSER